MSEKKDLVLKQSYTRLQELLETKEGALPAGFNETRFLQNCMTVLQDTKDIEKMSPVSVSRTMLKGAFLGLDFFNRECYAIPYGTTLNFQTDYKGEIKLAKKHSINPIKDIYAKNVREGDFYEEKIDDGQQSINFKPIPFNTGKIIGSFAVCLYHDGSMIFESMPKEEIEKIRDDFSKMPKGTMWVKTPGEAYKKTVLRRLCKLIELDFNQDQKRVYDEANGMEFKEEKKEVEKSPFEPIDVTPEETEEDEFGKEVEEALGDE